MRRVWRLVSLFVQVVVHTVVTRMKARSVPESERAAFRAHRQMLGCRLICRVLGIRITCGDAAWPERPALCVSNHIGMLDPFMIASQHPVAFAAKAEIQQWPLLGTVAEAYGVFFVDRGRRSRVAPFVEAVQERLVNGVCVTVFPEGGTNAAFELLPFKTGAFEAVAGRDDMEVVPLYLHPVAVEGQPAVGARRELVVWANSELSFVEKLWQIMGLRSMDFELRVGRRFAVAGRDRKELACEAQERVAALARRTSERRGDGRESEGVGEGNLFEK